MPFLYSHPDCFWGEIQIVKQQIGKTFTIGYNWLFIAKLFLKKLKACVGYFHHILFFYEMIVLKKLWKMLFISSKKLFFVFLSFPLFLPVNHCFRGWSKINLKVHDVINCLNKYSITHFVWYLQKEKKVWHWNFVRRWSIR